MRKVSGALLSIFAGFLVVLSAGVRAGDPPPPCDNACRERDQFLEVATGDYFVFEYPTCELCQPDGKCEPRSSDKLTNMYCIKRKVKGSDETPQIAYWIVTKGTNICGGDPKAKYFEATATAAGKAFTRDDYGCLGLSTIDVPSPSP